MSIALCCPAAVAAKPMVILTWSLRPDRVLNTQYLVVPTGISVVIGLTGLLRRETGASLASGGRARPGLGGLHNFSSSPRLASPFCFLNAPARLTPRRSSCVHPRILRLAAVFFLRPLLPIGFEPVRTCLTDSGGL